MYAFAFIHLLECVTIKVVVYKEIYNGKRWRTDQLYKAPMGEVGDLRVFLNDFLYFTHPVPLVKFNIFLQGAGMLRKVGIHSTTYKNCVYIHVHQQIRSLIF